MKKLFLTVFIIVCTLVSGCAVRMSNGQQVLFWQRGIVLTVDHQCTNHALVYYGSEVVANIDGAAPR